VAWYMRQAWSPLLFTDEDQEGKKTRDLVAPVFERFEKEGIVFAFPNWTVYLANDEKRQLKMQLLAKEDVA